jgi:uncharacterized protein (TIGR01777 family)
MRVAITGSTGLVGSALVEVLRARGHQITRVVRLQSKAPGGDAEVVWNPAAGVIDGAALENHDAVVHLAGESIAGVWTAEKKRKIRDSREQGTRLLARALAGLSVRPNVLVSGSAMGIYGDRPPHQEVTEDAPPGEGFLAEVAQIWEGETRPAAAAGIRVVNTRFGNVLSPRGGMLPVLLPLFRLGFGAKFGTGQQMWPWIALEDVPLAILHIIERAQLSGPVNMVAPQAVTNEEFTRVLAAAVGRWAVFSVPSFAARIAPGGMAEELLLSGARMVPKKLLDSGYQFRWPRLREALEAMLD